MPYTPEQRKMATVAAMHGYKISEQFGVPIKEFKLGDGVIVITNRGEPINSGLIDKIDYPNEEMGTTGAVQIGDDYYPADNYFFRRL